ncbi:HAD family hydrolase [Sulfurimonas sp.]|uniref:HAD family hydrolase n=1 Tax=Sulfurimonas sp. TaxID=2022749 RepID=UPI0025CC41B7|nr:HAD family hydrolase [Sulfurimonas sp.]MBT5934579.1 haloacid dehalogenase-like hydrolase [Sulfurimonas sp.]
MILALFDFDGTLTTKDSLGEFVKYAVGSRTYYLKLLLFFPIFILYKTKIMDNSYAKQLFFRLYFSGIHENSFKKLALRYSDEKLPTILNQEIYKKFLSHIENGDRVLVVSASMRCWLEPFTSKHNVELLSTELEFINTQFSGRFSTKNCHGEEKLSRIKKHLNLDEYDAIYAYGDSSGDKQMLEIADFAYKI